ncbi:MAG: hypothetical protein M3Y27_00265 [Acidobacteriota bacterium]|nr:hypothetical protein [Acidobacteriota bacterium]
MRNNPIQLFSAPRCGAKTRRGTPCRSPAVRGKRRCRMHGGNSPGAPMGNRNAVKHGRYTLAGRAQHLRARQNVQELRGSWSLR